MSTPSSPTTKGRLSREQVRHRVLAAAVDVVERRGITSSVDYLSFESVIEDAAVSRSTAYRIWPSRELFLEDVICSVPSMVLGKRVEEDTMNSVGELLGVGREGMQTAEGRRAVFLETIRLVGQGNFDAISGSPAWRAFAALAVTVENLPEGESRDQLLNTLRRQQNEMLQEMGDLYRRVSVGLGLRLRPEFGGDHSLLAAAIGAIVEGFALMHALTPEPASTIIPSVEDDAEWSLVTVTLAAVFERYFEPIEDFDGAGSSPAGGGPDSLTGSGEPA